MRTHTVAERNRMKGALVQYHTRLEAQNGSGTWKELTNLGGFNFFNGAALNGTLDNPVASATFRLRKAIGTASLAPLMESSGLNRLDDGITYAPLLNSGRRIRFTIAITDAGIAPISGDWHVVFDGKIDRVDWAPRYELTLTCRDRGAYLLDNTIIDIRRHSTAAGMLLEDVIQDVITANEADDILVVPDPPDPAWVIRQFDQPVDVSVMEAIRNLAAQIAFDVRYDFTTGDNFELLLYEPDRAKTIADESFGPGEYIDVPVMGFDDEGVRNDLLGWFTDRSIGKRTFRRVKHPGSILEFKRRPLVFSEEATSQIDTPEEMLRMLNGALSDLALPIADKAIRTKLFWPAQLGDLYAFPSNSNHYDTEQKFAVVAWQHEFTTSGKRRVANAYTTLTLRGAPSGGYRTWLEKAGPPGEDTTGLPNPTFGPNLITEGDALGGVANDGRVWWDVEYDKHTKYIKVWAEEGEDDDVSTPDIGSPIETAITLYRPPGTEGDFERFRTCVPFAITPGKTARLIGAGFNENNQMGPLSTPPVVTAEDTIPGVIRGTVDNFTRTPTALLDGYLLSVDVGDIDPTTESYIFIERDNIVIFQIPLGTVGNRTVNTLDLGLLPGVKHTYLVYIWTAGHSGAPFGWLAGDPPDPQDPADTTPRLTSIREIVQPDGSKRVRLDWELNDPLANRINLYSGPNVGQWTFRQFFSVVSAPDNGFFLDEDLSSKLYMVVSSDVATTIKWSAPYAYIAPAPPPGGESTVAPVLTAEITRSGIIPVKRISWVCDNGDADVLVLQSSLPASGGPWTDVFDDISNVSEGEISVFALPTRDHRMLAVKLPSTVLATSNTV